MTLATLNWAMSQDLPAMEKLVLLTAAYRSGDPAMYWLHDDEHRLCGMTEPDFADSLGRLVEQGFLSPTDKKRIYQINEPKPVSFGRAKLEPEKRGFIYVIASPRAIKVGITKDVSTRLSGLQTSSPDKLTLLFSAELKQSDCRKAERLAHKLLEDYRLQGEWFDVGDDVAIDAVKGAVQSLS